MGVDEEVTLLGDTYSTMDYVGENYGVDHTDDYGGNFGGRPESDLTKDWLSLPKRWE